jgi:hypothetical protein
MFEHLSFLYRHIEMQSARHAFGRGVKDLQACCR